MRTAEDKRKGLPRPRDYVAPPPPALADVARTVVVASTDIVSIFVRLATERGLESTATEAGLVSVCASFRRIIGRLGLDLDVVHAERVPREGGLLLMWNQESHLDHLVLAAAIPRPFLSLYNNAVARVPFYGAHMRRTGHLHVDRTDEAQWRAGVETAAARARAGACILVSPEGTRSWDGNLLPMKRGAFILASAAAQPIVCVTVIGGHERMPRGSAFVRRGPIRVVFSEPIEAAGETEARLQDRVVSTFRSTKEQYRL